jgi:DNA-binding LacI/PurR family transcriptional regulator
VRGTKLEKGTHFTGVNLIEIAKKTGFSKSTVSRAINNSYGVSDKTREKVMLAVKEMKYRPNTQARNLRTGKSRRLGILIPEGIENWAIRSMVNSQKIEGIVNKAKEYEYDVLIFIENINNTAGLRRIIEMKSLDGIVLLNEIPAEFLLALNTYGIPFIQVNWSIDGCKNQNYVKTDIYGAALKGLECILGKGYSSIGVINWMGRDVEKAFHDFMKMNKRNKGLLKKNENILINVPFRMKQEEVDRILADNLKDAYLVFSYSTAVKFYKYCSRKKLNIPADIALLSYDNFSFFRYLIPPLSGIDQKFEEMGKTAAESLIRMIKGEIQSFRKLTIPEIAGRESC